MKLKAYVWDDEYSDKSHIVWAITREKLKRYLQQNTTKNLQNCALSGCRGLTSIKISIKYQQQNFLNMAGGCIA